MPTTKNTFPLAFGLLGLGQHAQRVVLPVFNESNSTTLVTAASHTAHSRATLPESCEAVASMQAVLDHPQTQAVYISLPNNLHAEWVTKALNANKHVLCEKPLCVSLAEAKQIHSLSIPRPNHLVEAFMYRHHPQHQIVKTLIAEGAIGDIQSIEIHYHYFLDDPADPRLRPESGGGALLDVGCYGVDAARFLLGQEPCRVSASSKISEEFRVDECTSVQLEFPSGISASILCGCRMARQNSYCIYGTRGTLRAHDAFHCPRTKVPRIELISIEGKGKKIEAPAANHFVLQLDQFAKLVRGEETDPHLLGSGLENMRILEAARQSANTKRSSAL